MDNVSKIKAAILLSGFMRIFRETFENQKLLFSQFDECDFYIHTWDRVDCGYDSKNFEQDIIDLYHPKKIVVEPYFEFDTEKYPRTIGRTKNVLSMFYKIKKCFDLIEDINYDCVVRTRLDYPILQPPSVHFVERAIKENSVLLPAGQFDAIYKMNDKFAISNYNTMKKYSSLSNLIPYYYNHDEQMICPEYLLGHHLQSLHIPYFQSDARFVNYTFNDITPNYKDFGGYKNWIKEMHPDLKL